MSSKALTALILIAFELSKVLSIALSSLNLASSASKLSFAALLSFCKFSIVCFIVSKSPELFFKFSSCTSLSFKSFSSCFFVLFTSSNLDFGINPFNCSAFADSTFSACSSDRPNFNKSSLFIIYSLLFIFYVVCQRD